MKNFIFKINRALVAEKKLFLILAACVAIVFTSCENQGAARAIIGNSYKCAVDADNLETFYFSPSGSAQLFGRNAGSQFSYTHLTYKINNYNVEVYFDYSDFWVETSRGELLAAFTYMPEQDYLKSQTGNVYYRVK